MTAVLPQRRFPWLYYWIACAVIVLLAIWPLISVWLTYAIADANGCQVNEGGAQPCLIWGMDWGNALYTMGVLGWLMLATLPFGGGALVVWIVLISIHYLAWRKRKSL